MAVERPERHPGDDAALVGGGQCQRLRVAGVHIGSARRDDALGQQVDAPQRQQQGGDVHAVLRQVELGEEQALDQQPDGQADGRRTGAEQQQQGRAEDQVHFRDAYRVMRQDLEEAEHQNAGNQAAQRQGQGPAVVANTVTGQLDGQAQAGDGRGIAEEDLGAFDDTRFDMHEESFSAPTAR